MEDYPHGIALIALRLVDCDPQSSFEILIGQKSVSMGTDTLSTGHVAIQLIGLILMRIDLISISSIAVGPVLHSSGTIRSSIKSLLIFHEII